MLCSASIMELSVEELEKVNSNCIEHYNDLLERAEKVDIQTNSSIEEAIQFTYDMLKKEQEVRTDDERLILYHKIVIYITEKLPTHPTWCTVGKKRKEVLYKVTQYAFNQTMSLKDKIILNHYKQEKEKMYKRQATRLSRLRSPLSHRSSMYYRRSQNPPSHSEYDQTQSPSFIPIRATRRQSECSTVDYDQSENDQPDDHPASSSLSKSLPSRHTLSESSILNYGRQSLPSILNDCSPETQNSPHASSDRPTPIKPSSSFPDSSTSGFFSGQPQCHAIRKSVSLPSFQDVDDFDRHLMNAIKSQKDFCTKCMETTVCKIVARIRCTCVLQSNFNEKKDRDSKEFDPAKKYDAFLLYHETGAIIGKTLLKILAEKRYKICSVQDENILGENVCTIYTNLISSSRYVIAVVTEKLKNDKFTKYLLDIALSETIEQNFRFLLPIIVDCEPPYEMRNIGSYRVCDSKNPNIEEITEQLVAKLSSK